ncbi:hypothetical protein [Streptosporangium sp. NPDC002524]|uniref:hypothetical protein n=1 Tax=Streptosporangium sp. NPDC002524 TaxID=3154537 RepID=UPI00332C6B10
MTVIAGLVHEDRVLLGGDTAPASALEELRHLAQPKVFGLGPYVLGFTGAYRPETILKYMLKERERRYLLAAPPEGSAEDVHHFVITKLVPVLRKCLSGARDANKEERKSRTEGTFLLGVRGQLFTIEARHDAEYEVEECTEEFTALGAGAPAALAALHATAGLGLGPTDRLSRALSAANRFADEVQGPFYVAIEAR